MIVQSHCYPFERVAIILNNFRSDRESRRALKMGKKLVRLGLATDVIVAREYLTESRLSAFGLNANNYWQRNPNFSSAQLTGLAWAAEHSDYVLHMNGDVWLQQPVEWVGAALDAAGELPKMAGFNLCRDIYRTTIYPERAHDIRAPFWIATGRTADSGININDCAYVLKTKPDFPWRFDGSAHALMSEIKPIWPVYARPCFEMMVTAAIYANGGMIGTLQPGPITEHKNFPASAVKALICRVLRLHSPGGRFATGGSNKEPFSIRAFRIARSLCAGTS
jgi:hypothetical protein